MIPGVFVMALLCLAAVGAFAIIALVARPTLRHSAVYVIGILLLAFCALLLLFSRSSPMPQAAHWSFAVTSDVPQPAHPYQQPAPPDISSVQTCENARGQDGRPGFAEGMKQAELAFNKARTKAFETFHGRYRDAISTNNVGISPSRAEPGSTVAGVLLETNRRPWRDSRDRSRGGWSNLWNLRGVGVPGTIVAVMVLAAFLYVGYVLLDASTRGHFTWSLRLLSIAAFAALMFLAAAVHRGL